MIEEEIIKICEKYNIENYTINPDMTIDVNGDVNLCHLILESLPLKFGKVTGFFQLYGSKFTTLKGCPNHVDGWFSVNRTKLTTLHDLPINFYIGGNFDCYANNITEVKEFGRLFFGYIGGEIYTGRNVPLSEFLNKNKNPPKKDLPKLLSELRKIQL